MIVFVVVALCIGAPMAHGVNVAPNYAATPLKHGSGAHLQNCRGWGGDADDAGRFYSVCLFLRDVTGDGVGDVTAPALVEYSPAGVVQRIGWLPSEYAFVQGAPANYVAVDVAVSPDGSIAYVSVGPNLDNLGARPDLHPYTGQQLANGARAGAILRLVRQRDGSWLHDSGFTAGPFLLGANHWSARRLDVDATGRLYASVNAYVFELSPATGGIVTYFGGGVTDGPGGRWLEGIDKAQGLSVSADGNSIYVVEQQHQLVQRWLRVGATDWRRDTGFLLGVPDAIGDYCATTTHFQSPYDVAQDVAGDVYVMDTTCNRIQRFTRTGAFVQTVWQDRTDQTIDLSHGFAVSWQGSIVLPTPATMLTRLDPPARPLVITGGGDPAPASGIDPSCRDRTAPRIRSVRAAKRSRTRSVTIKVRATDDCGVAHIRVRGARSGRAAWTRGSSTRVSVTGWNGRKSLTVQVRDGAGRIATRRIVVSLALPQPRLRVRSAVRISGRGCSPVNPLRRISGASRYQLVDRCARLSGRAMRVSAAGRGRSIQLVLTATNARRIYANAVGPVRIWIVTDSRTNVRGTIRAGRTISVLGSIIATHNLRSASAIPVDEISSR